MAQLQANEEAVFIAILSFRDSIKRLIKTGETGLLIFYCGQCGFKTYQRTQKGPHSRTHKKVSFYGCAIFTLIPTLSGCIQQWLKNTHGMWYMLRILYMFWGLH